MYPKSRYFGLKVVPLWVLPGRSTYKLGTWTLRASTTHHEPRKSGSPGNQNPKPHSLSKI